LRGISKDTLLSADVLGAIRTPAYFLWGEGDPIRAASTARAFTAHIPGAKLEMMPGAGHAVWVDDAEYVAGTTRRFLAGTTIEVH
jgi:pimeloyl-[acyl-carrier protein] methyl ester esterase